MEYITTNDCFHHLVLLLRLHKKKDFLIEIFKKKGWDVTPSKINSWRIKSGEYCKKYREMPREALDDFIFMLHELKLVDEDDEDNETI